MGEDRLWLEPQPWAVLGGAASPEQAQTLAQAVDELVRRPSPIGAMLMNQPIRMTAAKPGMLTNGGAWPSITGTLVWALARVDGQMAWDEWKKNSLARHAEAYPEIWCGIWSGPDSYNSVLSPCTGQTSFDEALLKEAKPGQPPAGIGFGWTDFPVMNMHPHAWPLYSTVKLLGIEFNEKGVALAPALPLDAYRFQSPLLGLVRSTRQYEGWYAPRVPGKWLISLHLPRAEQGRFSTLRVNGKKVTLERTPEGAIEFQDFSTPEKPLRWVLT